MAFRDNNRYRISFVDLIVEERSERRAYRVGFRSPSRPKCVRLLPGGSDLAFTYENGRTYLQGSFDKFQMIEAEF